MQFVGLAGRDLTAVHKKKKTTISLSEIKWDARHVGVSLGLLAPADQIKQNSTAPKTGHKSARWSK